MPPKKDDKKKGGAGRAKIEINKEDYVRPAVALPGVEVPPFVATEATIANIEQCFPEWEVTGENWSETLAPDAVPAIVFPSHIVVKEYKGVKAMLGIEEVAVDPKKAKDAKKGAPAGGGEMAEPELDEAGKPLPRMVLTSTEEDAVSGFVSNSSSSFRRVYSDDQKARQEEHNKLQQEMNEAVAAASADAENEEAVALASSKQAQFTAFVADRDVTTEAPAGPEVDVCMCSVFRLVSRYAPAVMTAAAGEAAATVDEGAAGNMHYLWRSVYPKLPSGRPCYNPAGKYCVRLFLGGKWRKVTVTDSVPLGEDNLPAVASSTNPLELWPIIVSKAVYAMYTACGYSSSLSRIMDETMPNEAHKVAHFMAFALHALTSWQPSTPWSVAGTVSCDTARAKSKLHEMLFGGAIFLNTEEIPGPLPDVSDPFRPTPSASVNETTVMLAASSSSSVTSTSTNFLQTKRHFNEEYRRKQETRNLVVKQIEEREQKIAKIDATLKKPFGEGFVVCMRDKSGEMYALPVLAVSFPEGGINPSNEGESLREVKLLVDWAVLPAVEQVPIPAPDASVVETAVERMRRETPPLPVPTPICMKWISISELVLRHAFIFGIDTCTRLPFKAVLGWHWRPSSAAAAADPKAKDAKGKGKDAKGGAPAASSGGPEQCTDPGALPPVLIKVSNGSFFAPVVSPPTEKVQQDVGGEEDEAAAALAAQEREMEQLSAPKAVAPKSSHLSFSIMIHADMPILPSPQSGGEESEQVVQAPIIPELPSSVVVVLQELRADGEDPLVMRVELSQSASIPISRATFHIPADRLAPSEPLVFWVRLFTQASVYMTFGCGVEIAAGEAESIWQQLGRSVMVREGETGPVAAQTEQIVCRIPLNLQAAGEGSDEEDVEDNVVAFMYTSDRSIQKHLSLMVLADGKSSFVEPGYSLPRIDANTIALRASVPRLLVSRCFSSSSTPVQAFTWKTVILSRKALVEPIASVACFPSTVRYSGRYSPNNRLVVFRDVISAEKTSFPLALRLALGTLPSSPVLPTSSELSESDSPVDALSGAPASIPQDSSPGVFGLPSALGISEGISLLLRTFRNSDGKFVGEYKGRGLLQVYNLAIDEFLEDGEEPPAPVPAGAALDAKGGKAAPKKDDKGKGGKGGGASVSADNLDILFELSIDETAMHVPTGWRSKLPYCYDAALADTLSTLSPSSEGDATAPPLPLFTVAPVKPQFTWQMDVLCGSVSACTHDVKDLEKYANIKNAWEEASEGRADRAAAALACFQERKKARLAPKTEVVNVVVLEKLIAALVKEEEEIKNRESVLLGSSEYKEYIEPRDDGADFVLIPESELYDAKNARTEEEAAYIAHAKAAADALLIFNENVKSMTQNRILALSTNANDTLLLAGEKWKSREKYRLDVDATNASLVGLLASASGAIEKCADLENPEAAAAKAKAGGKKK